MQFRRCCLILNFISLQGGIAPLQADANHFSGDTPARTKWRVDSVLHSVPSVPGFSRPVQTSLLPPQRHHTCGRT